MLCHLRQLGQALGLGRPCEAPSPLGLPPLGLAQGISMLLWAWLLLVEASNLHLGPNARWHTASSCKENQETSIPLRVFYLAQNENTNGHPNIAHPSESINVSNVVQAREII